MSLLFAEHSLGLHSPGEVALLTCKSDVVTVVLGKYSAGVAVVADRILVRKMFAKMAQIGDDHDDLHLAKTLHVVVSASRCQSVAGPCYVSFVRVKGVAKWQC